MELRRSPTLEIGEKIEAAQKANKKLYLQSYIRLSAIHKTRLPTDEFYGFINNSLNYLRIDL